MIEEEQEEAMEENISSLKERIFNMASLTINSNVESDFSILAFEDCQSLLDFSAASAFVDWDNSMISVSMLTKIMYTINLLFELKKRADEDKVEFKLPKVGTLLNYQHNKFNKIPLFPTTAIIAPLAIFSDDTSGNLPKTYIMYNTVSQQAGFKSTQLMSILAVDLKSLENSIEMYLSTYNETVTVCALLLFITADNAHHAKLVGLKHATSNFPYRRCYHRSLTRFSFDDFDSDHLVRHFQRRTKEHCRIAATDPTCKEKAIPSVLLNIDNIYMRMEKPIDKMSILTDLGYSHTGAKGLLCLQSFDPALDTPEVLKGNTALQVKLSNLLEQEKGSRDFTRTFRKKLRHSGSYLDKELIILVQVLPAILNAEFANDTEVSMIAKPFTELGILLSLLFVQEVNSDFDQYLSNVNNTARLLVKSLWKYDVYSNTKFSLTLKTHLLLHLKEDIKRFGCALYFETEKGEQFNKFIQTHLVYSNYRADNRDLAFKFEKQDMLRHIASGSSWINRTTGTQVKSGSSISAFLQDQGIKYSDNYFGKYQEFVDSNHVKTKVVTGVSVAFFYKDNICRLFVGRIMESNSILCIQYYQLFSPNLNLATVGCQPSEHYCNLEEIKIECMLHLTSGVHLSSFGLLSISIGCFSKKQNFSDLQTLQALQALS
ncbi:hypothetical protein PHYBLDRAFT_141962 [Phycomyces blakesleeanus NRRL 1555(-)]|uniref:Uncharacterized protein n=1 Tax=Phycomyces blakesleeanus (strain ATCC 8743b / DSM 1359 / FGSC 10004 / NBRC 33097 / NRRL 1555) TaxID=763407 RepID=A0A167PJU5_PHYB8|nr:hypothetical protein PHYBLDRAFT_141962 [Phycomyces blakesleeanus NRRL 1555(-)]OAD78096.1 hypothetical protein PHYBLDRAFT_141962 [Phycomyces blakesleeanus NRRL 1555(-)]|eukprot:XP_018296136.1 hypothetical protein PHYBLDRAFT_141962 [Phycomyces blakesleeanus NRRL 1555(-)]